MLFSKYLCVPFVRTFGFSATSTYNSYLPLIFGKFPWIWCYFQNICVCRLWGLWGQRRPHGQKAGFWGWKKSNKCKKIKYPTLVLYLMVIFQLEMGLNQQLSLKNSKLVDFIWFLRRIFYFYFDFFSASKSRSLNLRPPLTSIASKT